MEDSLNMQDSFAVAPPTRDVEKLRAELLKEVQLVRVQEYLALAAYLRAQADSAVALATLTEFEEMHPSQPAFTED
jgi:hypothetical protein